MSLNISTIKIAMGQLLVEGGEIERNLQRAEKLIRQAKIEGAQLVLLPETLDCAWTHPSLFTEAECIPGKISHFFSQIAAELKIWLCVGLTEKANAKYYNAALLIDNEGSIMYKYHKINLLEVEFPFYEVGKQLGVVDTPFGKVGINICADNYLDSLHIGHVLARMGAQIILSPSSWTVDFSITEEMNPYHDKWIKPLTTLAVLYEIPIISTTSVGYIVGGPYEGKKMVGCSLAIDKKGNYVQGAFNEFASDLKIVEIELGAQKWKGTQFGEMLKTKGYSKE
jgi:predicted amidohydrolase